MKAFFLFLLLCTQAFAEMTDMELEAAMSEETARIMKAQEAELQALEASNEKKYADSDPELAQFEKEKAVIKLEAAHKQEWRKKLCDKFKHKKRCDNFEVQNRKSNEEADEKIKNLTEEYDKKHPKTEAQKALGRETEIMQARFKEENETLNEAADRQFKPLAPRLAQLEKDKAFVKIEYRQRNDLRQHLCAKLKLKEHCKFTRKQKDEQKREEAKFLRELEEDFDKETYASADKLNAKFDSCKKSDDKAACNVEYLEEAKKHEEYFGEIHMAPGEVESPVDYSYISCKWSDLPRRTISGPGCTKDSKNKICVGYVSCQTKDKLTHIRMSTCSITNCGDNDAMACTKERGYSSEGKEYNFSKTKETPVSGDASATAQ